MEKVARAAPGARVFCRILTDGEGAEWPLSRKFGCVAEEAVDVLAHARRAWPRRPMASPSMSARSRPRPAAWDRALADASAIFRDASERGMQLAMVNLGGGFPTRYLKDVPSADELRARDPRRAPPAFRQRHSGDDHRARPRHGRRRRRAEGGGRAGLEEGARTTSSAGSISTSASSAGWPRRWTRRSAIRSARRMTAGRPRPCVIAGPTCDSADVLYEKAPYDLPLSLTIGDEVLIEGTGAYTTTYCASRLQRLRAA